MAPTYHDQDPSESPAVPAQEAYFRALAENVADVITVLDRDGVVSYVGPSVERVLGYRPEELIGTNHFAQVHPEDRERVSAAFTRLLATGSDLVMEAPYRCRRKDGGWCDLESVGRNLLDHPLVSGLLLSTREVTARKLVEQRDRLTSLGRQVAHELNNVLMGIQPVVEILRRHGSNNPQLLRFSDLVATSLGRGRRLTADLLTGKFHLSAPAAVVADHDRPSDEQQPLPPPRPLRVLLVEDDEAIACGLQWSLEAEGMGVRVVGKSTEVLPAIIEFRPDVMVLDLNLPDGDGRRTYERVAAQFALPVVFSSGHALERDIEALLRHPHASFLMKPYTTEELLQTIHQLLGAKESTP
jgi:PAS domain S-box-containing protein